eukprot:5991067-Amphidinium_carterae.4
MVGAPPPVVAMAVNGDFNILDNDGNPVMTMDRTNHVTMVVEVAEPKTQQPRLKHLHRLQLTMPQAMRTAPTIAASPTSPPQRPTSYNCSTGPSTTTPMDTMDGDAEAEEQVDKGDVPMRAQSVASSSSHSTISVETMMDIEQMMWAQAVSPECSPLGLEQLQESGHNPFNDQSSTERLKTFTTVAHAMPIQRDAYIPTNADNDMTEGLWWTCLTKAQLKRFQADGPMPGFKETRGDNVHKHHRFHIRPDHCINLAMHCRWNAQPN